MLAPNYKHKQSFRDIEEIALFEYRLKLKEKRMSNEEITKNTRNRA